MGILRIATVLAGLVLMSFWAAWAGPAGASSLGATKQAISAPAPSPMTGTYIVAGPRTDRRGTVVWTPTRCIQTGWCNGNYQVDATTYFGYIYVLRDGTGRTLMNWFYDPNGAQAAGSAVVSSQPDGSLSGPLTTYNIDGSIAGNGSMSVR